ncbi:MAG: SprT family zinc-dependent metalloprotease [Kiritimatiellae bacterium]|nr:SprT family zinc-dependent metalloprotease [Kiritimatiellia bacterium]
MPIDYDIKFSRRKTIAIKVKRTGEIVVAAPIRCSKKTIHQFVLSKEDWINKSLTKVEQYQEQIKRNYHEGELFPYKGSEYPLVFINSLENRVVFDPEVGIQVPSDILNVADLVYNWYVEEACQCITESVKLYSHVLNLYPSKLKISNMKASWGSCSSRGRVSIAWRLIMAPPEVLDYVVIHELAHLEHLNHSKTFWSHVEECYPNFKQCKKWLKQNAHKLSFEI